MNSQYNRNKVYLIFLLKMKLIAAILLFVCLQASAKTNAQNITFSVKNESLSNVIREIQKQSGYSFFYNEAVMSTAKKVTVNVQNQPLDQVLQVCFKDQPLSYTIYSNTVIINAKKTLTQTLLNNTLNVASAAVTITAKVVNENGEPMPGVSIKIKGTPRGTTTGDDGTFTIQANENDVLVISFVGYDDKEIKAAAANNTVIALALSNKNLEQVVVTALGIKRSAKALTYNVQEIKTEEVNKVKDANFVNSLAGKVAGVTINSSASGIGGPVRVVMRGAKSLFGNNNALYVVDGMPLPSFTSNQPGGLFDGTNVQGDAISNINPDDIETISVLTGPAATALYGNIAQSGVVLITTKKGKSGKLSVNLSNSTSFYDPFVMPQFQNTYGSAPGNYYSWGPKLDKPSSYDPKDFFQTGYNATNTISVSTGTDKNQTYFSAANVQAAGIIPNNKLNRYNFSIRNTTSLNDKLTLDINAAYVKQNDQNMLAQGQYINPLIPVYLFPRGDDIEKYQLYERYDPVRNFKTQFWPFGDLGFAMQNPYWITNKNIYTNNLDRYIFSAALKYSVNSWLNITGRARTDNTNIISEKKFYASTYELFASSTGAYTNNTTSTKQIYADVIATVNKSFGDFDLTVNAGTSILDTKYSLTGFGGNLGKVPDLFNFDNVDKTLAGSTQDGFHDQSQAIFASAQLGYRNMIFLDATGRNDWLSALSGSTAKSVFYPSVGLSGVLSDLFKLHSNAISYIKVRGSYGEVGNPPQRYITTPSFPVSGGNLPTVSSFKEAVGLQPERTKAYEAGINLKFLRNKISLDVTGYHSSTYNQIFNPQLPPSSGYTSFYLNAGQVDNKGIEASLSYNSTIFKKLQWTSTATFSLNRNKIIQLIGDYKDPVTGVSTKLDSLAIGGTGNYLMVIQKGGSIGDIYVNTLKTDDHGRIFFDPTAQTIVPSPNNYVKAGSANPRYNIGFNNSFSFGNFSLSFLADARIGGVGVSATQAILDAFGVSKTSAEARDNGGVLINGTKIPAQEYYSVVGGGVSGIGSLYVYSATNVRLREATLGYTLPGKWCKNKIKAITISATGHNLFMFYNKAPFDPESTASTSTYFQGIDYFRQPSLRSVGFSARIQF